jgi:hypothetical protein
MGVVRAFVIYEGDVDEARYQQHVEDYARKVPGATFRHGNVFGAPLGEPRFSWYAEFEWPDMESFRQAANSPEFIESGRDAMEMGVPFSVHFAEVSE